MRTTENKCSPKRRNALRDEFLRHCASIRDSALAESRAKTPREKLDLMMFSVLVLIDGENATAGPYPLTALSDDRKYETEIWGDLHEHWHRFEGKQ